MIFRAIGLHFGPLTIDVTFYPPLTLCLLLTLWLGPLWGIVPAYLTSLILALHTGIPLTTGMIFSLATPITLAVVWSSMVMLEVTPSLRTWADWGHFALLALIATGASSVGALVWNYHHSLPFSKALAVWEGWVLGDCMQVVLIVGLLLYGFHRPVQKWIATQIAVPPRQSLNPRFYIAVCILVFMVMIGVGGTAGKLFLASVYSTQRGGSIPLSVLRETLGEGAFFFGVYAAVAIASLIVFSSTIGSELERRMRDIAERKRVQEEREKLIAQLQEALSRVKLLSGMLPICAHCKKVRDDKGYWNQIEVFVREHSEAEFSHGICPECLKSLYPDIYEKVESEITGQPRM